MIWTKKINSLIFSLSILGSPTQFIKLWWGEEEVRGALFPSLSRKSLAEPLQTIQGDYKVIKR